MLLSDTTLNHSAGKTSYKDMRTVNGVTYNSYQETCRALGMLQDDELWKMVMEDARQPQMPAQMRELFCVLMVFSNVNDPAAIFEEFWQSMSEDFEHQIRTIEEHSPELQKWMLLLDIQERLESSGNGQMLIRVGEERFISPPINIDMTFRANPEDLFTILGESEQVSFRGESVPVIRLHSLFEITGSEEDILKGTMLIIKNNNDRYALLVDEVIGQQQLVGKSIDMITTSKHISGGAILGDGRVGLILDTGALTV